jgi:hypothetical protein
MNKNGKLDSDDFKQLRNKKTIEEGDDELPEAPSEEETSKNQVYEGRLSIESSLKNLDSIIDSITEGLKKKV